jgi:hypothetical protein
MNFLEAPICVVSFNRPEYLAQTLTAMIAAADHAGMRGPVLLFQDGAFNPFSKQRKATDESIEASRKVFRTIVPRGVIFDSEENMGIANNIYRAEQWAFQKMEYPVAVFMEDDMVVSLNYFNIMAKIYELTFGQPRIGMFAAYGCSSNIREQFRCRNQLGRMQHNWAFALTRAAWLEREKYIRGYMDILSTCDYRDRPLGRISAWYARMGWPPMPTNQDIAKTIAMNTLGISRLCTFVACGRYIGEIGQHFTPQFFAESGFASVPMFEEFHPNEPIAPETPPDHELDRLWRREREYLLSTRLNAQKLLEDDELVWIGRALQSVGAFGDHSRSAGGIVNSVGGLYPDGWFRPTMAFGFNADSAVRRISIECMMAPHLPEGTRISYTLNGLPVATADARAGEKFVVDIDVPSSLDGIEKLLRGHCSVTLDPSSVGFNGDLRPLSSLLHGIIVTDHAGAETRIDLATLIAAANRK